MACLFPKCLTIMSDSEYGYHVYYNDLINKVEFSFYTEEENIKKIIDEILFEVEKRRNKKNENNEK